MQPASCSNARGALIRRGTVWASSLLVWPGSSSDHNTNEFFDCA